MFVPKWAMYGSVVAVADVVYHLGYKIASQHVHPLVYIMWLNIGIAAACAVLLLLKPLGMESAALYPGSRWVLHAFMFSLPVLVMEACIMLTYTSGAQFSLANPFMSALIPILTLVVGIFYFGEKITLIQSIGLGLCVVGAACLAFNQSGH